MPASRAPLAVRACIICFLLITAGLNLHELLSYPKNDPRYSDFKIFMTAAELVGSGHGAELYRFDAQEQAQFRLYPSTRSGGLLPFNHPAYEVLLFLPLAKLGYAAAFRVWLAVKLALLAVAVCKLRGIAQPLARYSGAPAWLWMASLYSIARDLELGQDAILLLLLCVLAFTCFRNGRPALSGFLLALGCFKFQLVLPIVLLVFVLHGRWRALTGFLAGGFTTAAVSLLIIGPAAVGDYLHFLLAQQQRTPWGFFPSGMPNLRGLIHALLANRTEPAFVLFATLGASLALLLVSSLISRRGEVGHPEGFDLVFSFSVLTTLLISFHMYVHDAAMVLIPALVLLGSATGGRFAKPMTILMVLSTAYMFGLKLWGFFFLPLMYRQYLLSLPLLVWWLAGARLVLSSRGAKLQPCRE